MNTLYANYNICQFRNTANKELYPQPYTLLMLVEHKGKI
jgi:hypothetical protein